MRSLEEPLLFSVESSETVAILLSESAARALGRSPSKEKIASRSAGRRRPRCLSWDSLPESYPDIYERWCGLHEKLLHNRHANPADQCVIDCTNHQVPAVQSVLPQTEQQVQPLEPDVSQVRAKAFLVLFAVTSLLFGLWIAVHVAIRHRAQLVAGGAGGTGRK
mmetsp:Transcript_37151/g.92866  ORF Transcript_37151/g.92866 Transcript_37151/m.92866 type:complete len:164 (-) Transcript_37151:193-684(-)